MPIRLILFLKISLFILPCRAETIDCRVNNNLYLCLSGGQLKNVAYDDVNAVQTIDDIELHLEDLSIDSISKLAFSDVSNSSALYLRGNRLAVLVKHFFYYLDQLTYLDLKDNWISQIEDGAFLRLSNLETLLLDGNRLLTFQPGTWKGLASLREIYLTNNTINLRKGMFRELKQLETLALDTNNITEIPLGSFEGLKHLDLLYLSRNRIRNLDPRMFQGLGELSELDLGGNNIETLPGEPFAFLNNLEKLWLSGNRLIQIKAADFKGLDRLEWLHLNCNYLRSVDMAAFNDFKNATIEPGFIINGRFLKNFKAVTGSFRCAQFHDSFDCQSI